MKKIGTWFGACAALVFAIDWGVMGIKLFANSDYEIMVEAVIGCICFGFILIGALLRAFGDRCPHCGKIILQRVKYCPHCGKEI